MKKQSQFNQLVEYLKGQPNRWGLPIPQDCLGRSLLPLDQVAIPWTTDEGVRIFLVGTILGSEWERGFHWAGHVPIKLDQYFCEMFKLLPLFPMPPEMLTKFPSDPLLRNLFSQNLTATNVTAMAQAGGVLHINKIPVVSA